MDGGSSNRGKVHFVDWNEWMVVLRLKADHQLRCLDDYFFWFNGANRCHPMNQMLIYKFDNSSVLIS
ncbi:hypothetical protein BLOT_012730 [Blomia tropicalis]|nr:hypothetical protein BLOT_012730 [Blomia tropicalis]